jgi:putative intracellular protease/amidase
MKTMTKILLCAWTLLITVTGHAQQSNIKKSAMKQKKVLFVMSSTNKITTTGQPTGTWIEEFASPYYYLVAKGVEVTIATPEGGVAPIDPKSQQPDYVTASVKKFNADQAARELLKHTQKLADIRPEEYDAVFYPGGHGPTWDLPENKISISIIESFYAKGKPVALVCHGPAALVNAKSANGDPLIKGKKVAGFTNSEEQAGQTTGAVPFSLEDRLKERGAIYQKGADWQPFAVSDGKLLTGQNPASAESVAELLFKAL